VDTEGNQLPYIDIQRWKRVETAELVTLAALAGEIDCQFRRIVLKDYPVLAEGAEKGDYHLLLWENLNTGTVIFPNHTLLKDDEVLALNQDIRWRQALSLLVDRDEMNELVYLGMAGPVQGCFPESFANEAELWTFFEYDPDQANALLDELGLDQRDSQGWRLLPSGEPLQLTFEGYAPDTDVMAAGELFVASLQEAGINAAIEGVTNDLWWNRIYSSEYQAAIYLKNNSGALIQPIYARAYTPVQHSCYWAPEWGNWYETQGQAGVEPEGEPRDLQRMYDVVAGTIDQDQRIEGFTEIYHKYLEFFPDVICVGRAPDPGIVKNNFYNVPENSFQAWTLKTPALATPEQFFIKS
jgi:peptide/nickel transport system substrate-binding protein